MREKKGERERRCNGNGNGNGQRKVVVLQNTRREGHVLLRVFESGGSTSSSSNIETPPLGTYL